MCFFFFNDTATTEIYTLSLHDALPIFIAGPRGCQEASEITEEFAPGKEAHLDDLGEAVRDLAGGEGFEPVEVRDRKSTRLNSSHANISYAVFCLKKKRIRAGVLDSRKA